ncbi:MAG TPA: GSCFA domain-containing protein [Ideonella sp.]|nr:GSCFA domain-containing protein [Ideonella sp.]
MAISRETVIWGFRLILGREPESEEGLRAHLHLADEAALVEVLLRSPEFRHSGRFGDTVQLHDDATAQRKVAWPYESRAKLKLAIFGNCQAAGTGKLIQAMTGDTVAQTYETTPSFLRRMREGEFDLEGVVAQADLVLVQMVGEVTQAISQRAPRHAGKVKQLPSLSYTGFHPDCVYVARASGGYLQGPMGEYQSSIALWAWRNGLDAEQAVDLFCPEVYEALGFHAYHAAAYRTLVGSGQYCGLPLAPLIDRWRERGCFMHTVNHPKLFVLADVAEAVLKREGIRPLAEAAEWVDDNLARWPVWPVYPPLAEPLGLAGSYQFKLDRGFCPDAKPVLSMSLPGFVEASYTTFRQAGDEALTCERVLSEPYQGLQRFVREKTSRLRQLASFIGEQLAAPLRSKAEPATAPAASPYAGLPDHQFWRRAVERVTPDAIDPVVQARFHLSRSTRVATAGSCFAQNIARNLHRHGFNYLVVDADPTLPEAQARERGFGMYSARYGNVYTAQQLVQLFDRAHGAFQPLDRAWQREDGRFVDPFRPQIEPAGFAKAAEVEAAAKRHLGDVRKMFAELDVFVFTLGLTEAWRRREDGAVFPLAPGVAGGQFDPALYEFVNYGADEVLAQLRGFMQRLRSVNPRARVILTVSPVPLIATYEDRHVLVSTIHSKSVLRAAAGALAAQASDVDYFPSYEIITGPQAPRSYFEADLRSISEEGVGHVMRVFFKHYAVEQPEAATLPALAPAASAPARQLAIENEQRVLDRVVCDEEALDRHRSD